MAINECMRQRDAANGSACQPQQLAKSYQFGNQDLRPYVAGSMDKMTAYKNTFWNIMTALND